MVWQPLPYKGFPKPKPLPDPDPDPETLGNHIYAPRTNGKTLPGSSKYIKNMPDRQTATAPGPGTAVE